MTQPGGGDAVGFPKLGVGVKLGLRFFRRDCATGARGAGGQGVPCAEKALEPAATSRR